MTRRHKETTSRQPIRPYNGGMGEDTFLEEYFQICKRIYEQMERDGTWLWAADSTKSEDSIESKDNPPNS